MTYIVAFFFLVCATQGGNETPGECKREREKTGLTHERESKRNKGSRYESGGMCEMELQGHE